jgi:hypothetical protein
MASKKCRSGAGVWSVAREGLPDDATLGYKNDDGAFVPIEQPDLDDFDDEFEDFVVPSGHRRLRVTNLGRSFLLTALRAPSLNLRDTLGDRVMHLFEIGFYDTAIREACVQLEHEIRVYTRSDAWGDRLTEEFVVTIGGQKKFLESYLRTFRQEIRTVFKLIRNDFMHNLREADEAAAQWCPIAHCETALNAQRGRRWGHDIGGFSIGIAHGLATLGTIGF